MYTTQRRLRSTNRNTTNACPTIRRLRKTVSGVTRLRVLLYHKDLNKNVRCVGKRSNLSKNPILRMILETKKIQAMIQAIAQMLLRRSRRKRSQHWHR